jgi:PAS domain S-box-containing protein
MPARILIVEDERITAEDLRDILADLGYTVTASVSSGAEAIAQAEETKPDLALMDIRIRGAMDGAETASVLRQRFNIPVVYLTAHADSATVSRAKSAEPLGYVAKPFRETELHASIEIALHKHREDLKFQAKERLLADTLRAVAEGVISIDQSRTITVFNPAAEAWSGWPAEEALGKAIGEVFRVVDNATGLPVITALSRVVADWSLSELPPGILLVARGGERRFISGNLSPIRDHFGKVSGAVIVFGRLGAEVGAATLSAKADVQPGDDASGLGGFKMIAVSTAMRQALAFARRVAQSEVSTILLEGDSGTGKDVLAQFIHHYGRRSEGPFVALNCAAIPETLLESELFGYEKGAFTDARAPKAGILELASGGTIFLDEIGEMPVVIQAKLLRVIEEQTFRRLGGIKDIQVDVRVVAATNRKLTDAIQEGKFRLDLYYRLNVIQVCLPPLRERKDDIIPLAEHFIRIYNIKFKRNIKGLSHSAAALLLAREWPGNVRELRNVIERGMVLEETDWIQASSLQIAHPGTLPAAAIDALLDPEPPPSQAPHPRGVEAPFEVSLEETEKNLVKKALEKAAGNQTRAAGLLGVTRDTLRYKMKKFNLR